MLKPVYIHDCDACVYLDTIYSRKNSIDGVHVFDLYFCKGEPTIIARFGNEGYQYSSGIGFCRINPFIAFATVLANRKGFDVNRFGEFYPRTEAERRC